MSNISKITALDGTVYNIKDADVKTWARQNEKPSYTANEVGAVPKTGGVAGAMTGPLITPNGLSVYSENVSPLVYFLRNKESTGNKLGALYCDVRMVNNKPVANRFVFRHHRYDDSGNIIEKWEQYLLPENTVSTNSASYDILTSKKPVTVEQGGTDATTSSEARTNLDVYSKDEVRRMKSVTLGKGNTVSIGDIINSGEVGVLFVQQNSFNLNNLGYMALIRRAGNNYYISEPSWSTTETLRPTLDSSGMLSVLNETYSGTYVCAFIPFI